MSPHTLFYVGRDAAGRWVAIDVRGQYGGYFRDCLAAIAFAKQKASSPLDDVIMVCDQISLFPSGNKCDVMPRRGG